MSHISVRLRACLSSLAHSEKGGLGREEEEEEVNKSFDLLLSARSTVKRQSVCVILFK